LSDTPNKAAPVADSSDLNFYDVALFNMTDKDVAEIIHKIPDEDLVNYENEASLLKGTL